MKPRTAPLLNLGPTSMRWLHAIGVETRADLERLGALGAYTRVRAAGFNASLNLLYALEGALRGVRWNTLPRAERTRLILAADALEQRRARAVQRCAWATQASPAMQHYHDAEWGVPVHDDRLLFEFLILEGAQAGLSWSTILNKRERYRAVFDNFDAAKIAHYDARKVARLLADPGIVRNRLKIAAAIANARAFLAVQQEFGTFDRFIWQFVGGRPRVNAWKNPRQVPASTPESDAMSKALAKRSIKFVGSTICYAFMQAVGMVNDHTVDCFCYRRVRVKNPRGRRQSPQ